MLAENYNFEKYSQILHASTGIDIVSSCKIRNTGPDFIAADCGTLILVSFWQVGICEIFKFWRLGVKGIFEHIGSFKSQKHACSEFRSITVH